MSLRPRKPAANIGREDRQLPRLAVFSLRKLGAASIGVGILVALAVLYSWIGTAHSQDQNKPAVFPQLGNSILITSVAFSPDGKLLASGGGDNVITLWDRASGRELRTLSGHTDVVNSVAFSRDGKVLASGSDDDTIRLWDVASWRELRALRGHTMAHGDSASAPNSTLPLGVICVAFSPDGKILASGNKDNTINLWDVGAGRKLRTLSGHAGPVNSVAFSLDGKMLASGSNDKTIKLWHVADPGDLAGDREPQTLPEQPDIVTAVAFSPDGKVLASGTSHHTVKLWDLPSGNERLTLNGDEHPPLISAFSNSLNLDLRPYDFVTSLSFSPNGSELASASWDKTIKLWDVANGSELRTLRGHTDKVYSVVFSPDGKVLASGSFDHTIKLWDVVGKSEPRTLSGHVDGVHSVALSRDGTLLASGNSDNTIKLWDRATGHELRTLSGHTDQVQSVAFSPDGQVLASGSRDHTIKLWDVASGHELRTLSGHVNYVTSVAFSPDGKTLASGGAEGVVKLWDVDSGNPLGTLTVDRDALGNQPAVTAVAFSPDGKVLASGGTGNSLTLWDPGSRQKLRTLSRRDYSGNEVWISSVAFSPDSKTLASGNESLDNTIKLWDVASGRELRTLSGHTNWVYTVAFSPDGTALASGSQDNTIKLWDVSSGRELRTLSGHTAAVASVAFSHDGKLLASGGADGTTREWDLTSSKELAALVAFDDGSSLTVTPDGFFDSSTAQAEDYLNVRIGDRVFGMSSFREKFYRPDLVKLSLASGGSLSQFGNLAGQKLPPVVELIDPPQSTNDATIKINLRITDGGGGIGLVRVFLNGSSIKQDNTVTRSAGAVTRSYAARLLNGPNELRVVAFNADGSVQSNDATASITANLPPPPRGVLHALVVGIQDFPKSPKNNLTYSVADAKLFADTLKAHSAALFEKLDIRLLTTPAETDKDHLVNALKAMQATVGPGDEFVFYVASHGVVQDGEYYLVTANVGAAPDRLKTDAISRQQLTDLLANIGTARKLVIIDTCQAGALGDPMQLARSTQGMSAQAAATILSRQTGLTLLAATTTDQEAIEGYKDHGLFTYVVTDGLSGQAAHDLNGIVSNFGLADYVGAQVPPLASNLYQHEQRPTINPGGQRFAVAKVQ